MSTILLYKVLFLKTAWLYQFSSYRVLPHSEPPHLHYGAGSTKGYVAWKIQVAGCSMSNLFHGHFKYQRNFSGSIWGEMWFQNVKLFFFDSLLQVLTCMFVFPCMQLVDINLQQRKYAGIQFVIWSGGSWINNNGANFFVGLNSYSPSQKVFPILFSQFFMVLTVLIVPHGSKTLAFL